MRENDLSASVSLLKLAELQDENCLARDSDLLSPCLRVLLAFQILRLKIRERLLFAGSVRLSACGSTLIPLTFWNNQLLEVPGQPRNPKKIGNNPVSPYATLAPTMWVLVVAALCSSCLSYEHRHAVRRAEIHQP